MLSCAQSGGSNYRAIMYEELEDDVKLQRLCESGHSLGQFTALELAVCGSWPFPPSISELKSCGATIRIKVAGCSRRIAIGTKLHTSFSPPLDVRISWRFCKATQFRCNLHDFMEITCSLCGDMHDLLIEVRNPT